MHILFCTRVEAEKYIYRGGGKHQRGGQHQAKKRVLLFDAVDTHCNLSLGCSVAGFGAVYKSLLCLVKKFFENPLSQ